MADALGKNVILYRGLTGRERFSGIGSALGSAQVSRGLSDRRDVGVCEPRESAFGLIPGLWSPGPLGRMGPPNVS